MSRPWLMIAVMVAVAAAVGAWLAARPRPPKPGVCRMYEHAETLADPMAIEGIHNAYKLSDTLLSGSCPEGDSGFVALQRFGVTTVISVDGATPDVNRAAKFGMRYVHIPIGYDGVSQEQAWQLAKVVRDAPASTFVHCHHGKHRGPAAVAAIRWCLDVNFTPEMITAWLKLAGTDEKYAGLYKLPTGLTRPTAADLDTLPTDFPAIAKVTDFVQVMVHIDERWDHLKAAKAARWRTPPEFPDADPAHEAVQLREHYREALRHAAAAKRSAEFVQLLVEAETAAAELEVELSKTPINPDFGRIAFDKSAAHCAKCHAKYRDNK